MGTTHHLTADYHIVFPAPKVIAKHMYSRDIVKYVQQLSIYFCSAYKLRII